MKDNSYYFPHDFNARNDIKVRALIHDFSGRGYAIYWVAVEMLHEEPTHKLPIKPYTFIAIAQQLKEKPDVVEKIISACLTTYELFYNSDGFFMSNRVNANILKRAQISKKRSQAGKDGANAKQMLAIAKQNQAKEKKVKEIKEKDINIPFDSFWDLYDKKEDRKKCELKWLGLTDEERQQIIDRLPAYILSTPNVQYRKNPLTYLNGRCWEDEGHSNVVKMGGILKAVGVNENDQIIYEDGTCAPPGSYIDLDKYKAGQLDLSHFNRRIA